jgi:hypothetical protein
LQAIVSRDLIRFVGRLLRIAAHDVVGFWLGEVAHNFFEKERALDVSFVSSEEAIERERGKQGFIGSLLQAYDADGEREKKEEEEMGGDGE